ncbi:MAG: glycoside hydrolase family 3 C-terminal domain-containing protein [Acutalibacteraceae bacterium]
MKTAKRYGRRALSLLAAALMVVTCLAVFSPATAETTTKVTQYPFLDTSLSFEERAADLVSRLTLDEKYNQLGRNSAAVPRLGLAKYDYWNEALHGIQNGTGEGTSFPMPLSLAQTWDEEFITRVASAIADECRGHNQPVEAGGRGRGLTYWCPTVNLARHPLWGRTNEAYGEDAFVSGMLASAFVEGMEGDGKYAKTIATIKHYSLNNHENGRGSTSSDASEADIRDYYARVYRYIVERTDVGSLMSAYNAVNYTPSSGNTFLLTTLLRKTFGFTGFVTSDCGAIDNLEKSQKWQPAKNTVQPNNYTLAQGKALSDYVAADGVVTKPGSVALALMAGCDMDCNGDVYPTQAKQAYNAGLLTEAQINKNVYNILLSRFKLGEFDPDEMVAYRGAAYDFANVVENAEHRALADEAASKAAVLLKNDGDVLPLDIKAMSGKTIALVGPFVDVCWLGNYSGKPQLKNRISMYAGLSDYIYAHGNDVNLVKIDTFENGAISEADQAVIRDADVVVALGADDHDDSSEGHDREALTLTHGQNEIIAAAAELNPNTVVFLQTSNVVEVGAFKDKVKAIVWESQNGQSQGVGFANQLFGEVNVSGKLTFTWYADEDQLPGIRQYGLSEAYLASETPYTNGGFTYQYFKGDVDYPFGHGLSYTTYEYSNAKVDKTTVDANGTLTASVDVKNTGDRDGSEVVQVYVVYPAADGRPVKQIKGYQKLDLAAGEKKTATIAIDVADCRFWDETAGKNVVPTGAYQIEIGASSTDIKATKAVTVTGTLADKINLVTVDPADVTVAVGGSFAAPATVAMKDDTLLDSAAFLAKSGAKLTYTSSNPAAVTVDQNGTVRGVKAGTALITVKAEYNGSSDETTFPVAVPGDPPVEEVDACAITALTFPSVKLTTAQAASYKLAAQATTKSCNQAGHAGAQVTYTYAIVDDGMQTAPATLTGDTLAVTGEGRVTVSVTAKFNDTTKYATAQILVSDAVDRNALEEAIRIKVSGDDYDPETLAAYEAEIEKARAVFFDEDATQAEVDAAVASLNAVKDQLKDYRYLVADFAPANKEWPYNSSKSIWVEWSHAKDAEGRDVNVDFTGHDPEKLELRFTVTLTPSDYNTPFLDAASSGGYIKLRSVNVAQKDNDPDLQQFGGSMATNDEHNFGWLVQDYIQDWGTTEVCVPLAKLNPDGTVGLPFIDKGFKAEGPHYYSRGKIDWTCIDRFFMQINFKDDFKNKTSVVCKMENVRVVDVTLEEERDNLKALLTDKVDTEGAGLAVTIGELDGNEGVTAADALMALQAATGKITLTAAQTAAADVDGNGSVTAADALMILQYATGKIDTFPAEGGTGEPIEIDPDTLAAYEAARANAEKVIAEENVVAIKAAIAELETVRAALVEQGARITTVKDALKAALDEALDDEALAIYTDASVAEYKARVADARAVYDDPNATQLQINKAADGLTGLDSLLQLKKVSAYVLSTLLDEKSVENHFLSVSAPADLDLSEDVGYTVTLRYEIMIESTHPNEPLSTNWLRLVRNGKTRVSPVYPLNNETSVDVAPMNCDKDSVMTGYTTPGVWYAVSQEIPVDKLPGGHLGGVEIFMYNDTQGYVADPDDGNAWNNNTGVKLSVRNLQVLSDKPRDVIPIDRALLQSAINDASKINVARYTEATVARFTAALNAANAMLTNDAATQAQIDAATAELKAAKDALKLLREGDPTDVSAHFPQAERTETRLLDGNKLYVDWNTAEGASNDQVLLGGIDMAGTAANDANKNMAFKMHVKLDTLSDELNPDQIWKYINVALRSSRINGNEMRTDGYNLFPDSFQTVNGEADVVIPLSEFSARNIDWADLKQVLIIVELKDEFREGTATIPTNHTVNLILSDVGISAIDG